MKIRKITYQVGGGLFLIGLILNCQTEETIKSKAILIMFIAVIILLIRLFKDAIQKINKMTEDGKKDIQAYKEKHERFGIPYNAKSIKVLDSDNGSRFKVFNDSECKVWLNNDMLNMYHNEVLTGIEVDDIKCFARVGDIKQGEYSLGNAVAGYLLLGVAGAMIGGKKKAIDNRQTVLIVNEGKEDDCLILSSESYEVLLSIIPRKELTVSQQIS